MRWATLAGLLCVAGCLGFVHDEVLVGPYRLVAVDVSEDMSLCRSLGTDGHCVGDGLPEPTIFQAGWNAEYIVLARHPRRWPEAANRSITEFYYIVHQANDWDVLTRVSLIGPLNELEYEQHKKRLQLPEFSRVFRDLK